MPRQFGLQFSIGILALRAGNAKDAPSRYQIRRATLPGDTEYLVERRQAGFGLHEAGALQRLHPLPEGEVLDDFGAGVGQDLFAHRVADRKYFQNRETSKKARLLATRTPAATKELLACDP